MLRKGLPYGIYVQAYEDRLDLLRCFVIGPHGTPYQDGGFLFDLQLGEDFPTSPPSVHYDSYNRRLNPNLYETGKVPATYAAYNYITTND